MKVIKQTIRGMGNLPYVGEHPGILPLILLTVLFGCAGGLIGISISLLVFGSMFLYGAYDRAQLSDWIENLPNLQNQDPSI